MSTVAIAQLAPTARIFRIEIDNQQMVNSIAAEYDVWAVEFHQGYLVAYLSDLEAVQLRATGHRLSLDLPRMSEYVNGLEQHQQALRAADVQSSDQRRSPPHSDISNSQSQDSNGIPGFSCYRTVEETFADMATLAGVHPNLARWIDIGDTWDKVIPGGPPGYDINALVLTNQAKAVQKPKFLLLGAVHGRELATAELVTRFGEMLLANYNVTPDVTWLLDHAEIHIIPQANPDGRKKAEAGLYWRKNTNLSAAMCAEPPTTWDHGGVDLNRNSSFRWNQCDGPGYCSSGFPCQSTYRGSGPASEPETQALQEYMSAIFPNNSRPISETTPAAPDTSGVMVSVHSFGQLILFPWAWTPTQAPNHAELATLGRKLGFYTDYRTCKSGSEGCFYQVDGTHNDWAYGELRIPAYTLEIGTSMFQSCHYFEEEILSKNMDALLYAFKAAQWPYQLPSGPEVVEIALDMSSVDRGGYIALTAWADDTRYRNDIFSDDEPTQPIAAARYSLNAPSWIEGTQLYPIRIADNLADAGREQISGQIDTTNWTTDEQLFKRQTLFVEAQDAAGNWGVPTAHFLDAYALSPASYSKRIVTQFGNVENYTLLFENQGWQADEYSITLASTWPVSLTHTDFSLTAGQLMTVGLAIQVPYTTTVDVSVPQPISGTTTISPTTLISPTILISLSESVGASSRTAFSNTVTMVIDSHGRRERASTIEYALWVFPYEHYFPFIVSNSN